MINKQIQDWIDKPINGQPCPRRWIDLPPSSPIDHRPDWVPRIGDKVHIISVSGEVRELKLIAATQKELSFSWPGMYAPFHIKLSSGRSKVWRVHSPELRAIRKYIKELSKEK